MAATKLILTTGVVYVRSAIDLSLQTVTTARDGIAVTSTDGVILSNSTASTAGVPVQQSPRIRLRSNVWNTTVTAANNTDDWIIESVPVSGTTPSGLLKFGSSLNGGAYSYPMTLTSGGDLTPTGDVNAQHIVAAPTKLLGWGTRSLLSSGATGLVNITTNAQTAGVGFDVATDAVLKVRTRAQTGYATVDALAYQASGAAGVSYGPAGVTSITVVGGIITAIS